MPSSKDKPKDKKDYSGYPFMNFSLVDMKGEKWKPIPSFDGYIQVSNYGRIWSLSRPIHSSSGQIYHTKERIRKQNLAKYYNPYVGGYTNQLLIHIRYEGKSYNINVNRLVYDLFVKPLKNFKSDWLVVVHKDGDNCNNRVDNLALMSGSERYRHELTISRRPASARRIRKKNQLVWSDNNSPRPVVQYSLDGKKINEFESIAKAAHHNKVHRTSIREVIGKSIKQLNGFVYRFKGDRYRGEHSDFSLGKRVTCYSLEGRKIAVYESVVKASAKTGIDADAISKGALQKLKTAGGFVWRYDGKIYKGEYKDSIRNKARAVVQFDLEGKKVALFASIGEASRSTGFSTSTIADCARRNTKVSHGYVWRFRGDSYKGEFKNYKIGKPVTQFSREGKMIATYATIVSAAGATGLTQDNIQKNVNGHNKTAGGFVWKYATAKEVSGIDLQRAMDSSSFDNLKGRVVVQYTIGGKLVGQYDTISKASKATGIVTTNISAVIDKLRSAGGFVWRNKGSRYRGELSKTPSLNKARTITQYDLTGKKVSVFDSTKRAEKITGIQSSSISAVARGKFNTSGGFIWQYGDGPKRINISEHFARTSERMQRIRKPVVKYTLEGKLLAEYPSISEAARREGIRGSLISSVVNGYSLSANGYAWKFKK